MAKYDPLQLFLTCLPDQQDEIVLTFARIEEIIGATLPPNAYDPKGKWWNNTLTASRPQAHAWLSAGWKREHVDRQEKLVTFRRQS